jgi:triphosphoribosyl-dephospho-CoA synthase
VTDPIPSTLRRISASCRPWGRGWCATAACLLEALAPKPGNVHPAADFADLSHAELVAAGIAIGPPLDMAAERPLGRVVLEAVEASRRCTRSNANLGIVLAIAPLAAVPDRRAVAPPAAAGSVTAGDVADVLARLGPDDAADIWRAIAIANPGGMGTSGRWDVAGPPPTDLLEAMRLSAPHDQIGRLWSDGYGELLDGLVADLAGEIAGLSARGLRAAQPLLDAIVRGFLRQLARSPDSLIARKHGPGVAADVSAGAAAVLARADDAGWPAALAAFDRRLRSPRRINPGTTADLVAAALYILLRDGRLRPILEPSLEGPA